MRKDLLSITESAILIALAVALEMISKAMPIFQMPQGGSLSFAMLPLIIIGFRRGLKLGLTSGVIYGLLNLLIDGYTFHLGSFLFDYIFAFGVFGFSGLFKNKRDNTKIIILVFVLLGFTRYLFHSLSGVLFFANFAADSGYAGFEGAIYYSFIVYNLPYNLASTVINTIIAVLGKRIISLNLIEIE